MKGGICVANHTTPIDIIILANDRCYAMVGTVPSDWPVEDVLGVFHWSAV